MQKSKRWLGRWETTQGCGPQEKEIMGDRQEVKDWRAEAGSTQRGLQTLSYWHISIQQKSLCREDVLEEAEHGHSAKNRIFYTPYMITGSSDSPTLLSQEKVPWEILWNIHNCKSGNIQTDQHIPRKYPGYQESEHMRERICKWRRCQRNKRLWHKKNKSSQGNIHKSLCII